MLAVTASPRGLAAILLNEASLSQELCTVGLLQPHILIEYQWQNIGLSLEYSAQQTRRRLRVATLSEPDLQLSLHPALQGLASAFRITPALVIPVPFHSLHLPVDLPHWPPPEHHWYFRFARSPS